LRYALAIGAGAAVSLLLAKIGYGRADPWWIFERPLTLFLLIVFYPLIEETVFRGWIQGYLSTRIGHRYTTLSIPNILTTVLFCIMHLFYHSVFWAALLCVPSLVFGYFKDQTGLLAPSVVLHMLYNLFFFSLVLLPVGV